VKNNCKKKATLSVIMESKSITAYWRVAEPNGNEPEWRRRVGDLVLEITKAIADRGGKAQALLSAADNERRNS